MADFAPTSLLYQADVDRDDKLGRLALTDEASRRGRFRGGSARAASEPAGRLGWAEYGDDARGRCPPCTASMLSHGEREHPFCAEQPTKQAEKCDEAQTHWEKAQDCGLPASR